MTALLNLQDIHPDFESLGRRRLGDRLKAEGFEVFNDGDEASSRGAAQVTVSVHYDFHGGGLLTDALVIDLPRLDPSESFGPLTRAFALPEVEGASFGLARIIYTLSLADETSGDALGTELVAVDEVQITPFTRAADTVTLRVTEGQGVWKALAGADTVTATDAATSPGQRGVAVDGGGGNDTLNGSAGDDTLRGQNASDVLRGNAGNDVLNGGNGRDLIFGDAGNDDIDGGGGRDRIQGGDDADRIDGGGGQDSVTGNAGNDVVSGGAGRDKVNGGADHDIVSGGAGNDLIDGDSGRDVLSGGSGRDTFRFHRNDWKGDLITDYEIGEKLEFGYYIDSKPLLVTQSGDDLIIHHEFVSHPYNVLTLRGIDKADFDMDALIV